MTHWIPQFKYPVAVRASERQSNPRLYRPLKRFSLASSCRAISWKKRILPKDTKCERGVASKWGSSDIFCTVCNMTENDRTHELSELEKEQRQIDRAPFTRLKITDARILDTVEGREICGHCYKSRKFFCYTCCSPVIDQKYIPRVKLPIKIDIIKHAREIDGKSTAVHAVVLAPADVRIFTYPDFPEITNPKETVLIFPSKNAVSVDSLFTREVEQGEQTSNQRIRNAFPVKRAIFIDSTWHQTKAIYKDQRLRDLCCVVLKSRISQFWRHQKKSPRWYLATIEAIHQFLVELHVCAFGGTGEYMNSESGAINEKNESPLDKSTNEEAAEVAGLNEKYNGQYDDLLYFFKYMYEKIHTMYDHDKLWAYKRPLI